VRHIGNGSIENVDIETENGKLDYYFKKSTLFSEDATLINAHEWLLQADYATKKLEGDEKEKFKKRYQTVIDLLKQVLPDVDDIKTDTRVLSNFQVDRSMSLLRYPKK